MMSRIPSVKREKSSQPRKEQSNKKSFHLFPFVSCLERNILLTDFWILSEDIWNHAIFIMLNNSTDNC